MRRAALLFLLAVALPATARADECPQHHPGGLAPVVQRPALAQSARPLCFEAFAVLHSGVSRTPLVASQRLTRAGVEAARGLERDDSFHEEDRLPPGERARLADYARSGLDRGHMAPAGDMPSAAAQHDSFSLANIAPQHPASNRCLWAGIEEAVRDAAEREGELFVVTGPLFEGADLRRLQGRVLVPSGFFKAVLDPARGAAAAYVVPNGPGGAWDALSLDELAARSGIEVFPALRGRARARAMDMPDPRPPRGAFCGAGEARSPSASDPALPVIGAAIVAGALALWLGARRR